MSTLAPPAAPPARVDADVALALLATGTLAGGTVLALAGAAGGAPALAIAGGAAAGAALVAILTAGWMSGIALITLTLAAPAPYSSASLRLAPAAVATAAAVVAWVLRRALDRGELGVPWPLRRGAALLFAAIALSATTSLEFGASAREVINWVLLLLLFVMAVSELGARVHEVRDLARLLAVVMGVAGVLAQMQVLGVLPAQFHWGSQFNRATLGFGWPNELGMFMALGLPFSVHACRVSRTVWGRAFAVLGLGANLLGLEASLSRGSWVAVATASLVLLLCGERRFLLRIALGAVVAAVALDLASGGAVSGRIAGAETDGVAGQRIGLMLTGLLMFRAHPLLGVGPGAFEAGLQRFGPQIFGLWDYVASAHNLYIHMAAETGLVGLAALLGFLATIFLLLLRSARREGGASPRAAEERSLRRAILWSFTTACVVGFFEWPFAHGVAELIMIVSAMGCALARRSIA